ncbi:MAG: hypothetical protein OXD30_00830 [Bryobacterales bacterium]|nr:hypothetical protein [Bryobacterales bacterium]
MRTFSAGTPFDAPLQQECLPTRSARAALGVVADTQPAWYHFDGLALARVLGPRRMGTLQPYRSIFDAGVIAAGGSDHMIKFDARRAVNPFGPLFACGWR